ncbi:MAG: acyltransferase, partial [Bacteroidota bacterium]
IKDNAVYGGASYPIVLILMNVFFVRGFFDDFKFTGVAQGWSLTVEECFYFLAPLFFIRIKKNIKYLIYLPVGLISIGLLLVTIFSHVNFYNFYGNCTFMFCFTFTGRCIEFFLGIYLAMIALKDNKHESRPIATTIGFIIIVFSIYILSSITLTGPKDVGVHHPLGILSNNLILPIGIALLFYGLISEKSWIRTFLSTKIMDILGKSSYIFYLIHIGFISKLTTDFCNKNIDQFYTWMDDNEITWVSNFISQSLLLILSVFIILNLISIVLYKSIEEPMNLYIRRSSLLETKKG